jgi:hypothetical protein
MKKVIITGDIHGRDTWKKIVEGNSDSDLFIFVGDYFDSFDIDVMTQIHNFREIIEFKNENPEKVVTLIGNHDFHYTRACIGSYTGFNHNTYYNMHIDLGDLIKDGTLKIAHQIENFLFTHAGVTKTFCEEWNIDTENLVDSLNDHLIYKPNCFNFRRGKNNSEYGDDIIQGPLWVRPDSLFEDALDYIHVVGHTSQMEVTPKLNDTEDYGYILVDTLGVGQYLELIFNDNQKTEINIKKIV